MVRKRKISRRTKWPAHVKLFRRREKRDRRKTSQFSLTHRSQVTQYRERERERRKKERVAWLIFFFLLPWKMGPILALPATVSFHSFSLQNDCRFTLGKIHAQGKRKRKGHLKRCEARGDLKMTLRSVLELSHLTNINCLWLMCCCSSCFFASFSFSSLLYVKSVCIIYVKVQLFTLPSSQLSGLWLLLLCLVVASLFFFSLYLFTLYSQTSHQKKVYLFHASVYIEGKQFYMTIFFLFFSLYFFFFFFYFYSPEFVICDS